MKVDTSNDHGNHIIYDIDHDSIIEAAILWADEEAGEYCRWAADISPGEVRFKPDENGRDYKEIITANIKIIDMRLPENSELCDRFGRGEHLKYLRVKNFAPIPYNNDPPATKPIEEQVYEFICEGGFDGRTLDQIKEKIESVDDYTQKRKDQVVIRLLQHGAKLNKPGTGIIEKVNGTETYIAKQA